MPAPIAFDEPCPCGSGALYRDCCGRNLVIRRRQKRNVVIAVIVLLAAAIPALGYMYKLDQQKREELTLPAGSYYSEEHRHWHAPDGTEIIIPGYVWSPVQMRWLKITDSLLEKIEAEQEKYGQPHGEPEAPGFSNLPEGQGGVPAPPGPAPEGKVWSPEHGHYHDIE